MGRLLEQTSRDHNPWLRHPKLSVNQPSSTTSTGFGLKKHCSCRFPTVAGNAKTTGQEIECGNSRSPNDWLRRHFCR